MTTRPTFAQTLRAAIDQKLAAVRVALPGEIVSFDASTQTAQVKPLLADQFISSAGESEAVSLGVLSGVPVVFAGGGGFAETWPVAQGDPCLLVFSDRSLDLWFDRGGEVEPDSTRRHDLSDAIAILGVRSKPGALSEFDTSRAVWGNNGPRIAADGSALHLGVSHGENGSQSAVRGSAFVQELGTLLDLIDTATTNAGTGLSTAGSAQTAASVANAVPIVGGAIAATPFATAGASLVQAGAALLSVKGAIASFKAKFADFLQNKVKLP